MKGLLRQKKVRVSRNSVFALAAVFALVIAGSGAWSAQASAPMSGSSSPRQGPALAQDFEDVPTTNPFYNYVHNIYADGIVSGYTCGGANPPEPCVPPANLPYYRPSNYVTRGQMGKFVDLGRRNIADATGTSLVITNTVMSDGVVISTTNGAALRALSSSGIDGVHTQCTRAGQDCWALHGVAAAGDYAGFFSGGRGVHASSSDSGYPAVQGQATGPGANGTYGGEFSSDNWNALRVDPPPAANGRAQVYVSGTAGNLNAEDIDPGALYINGNLTVTGSKSGYVVDAMQNADSSALEQGDVVVIAGDSAPVLGQIPVVTVKKATSANDTAVAGVVDQALYVPDAATRAAYEAQQAAVRSAEIKRNQALAAAKSDGSKPDLSNITMPKADITDERGIPHATDATSAAPGGYINVVTLGAYKTVKVDASFGAIKAGDLLTTSSHAGYAMKVTDKAAASGAINGKALSSLQSGTGTVTVMVTLK